MNLLTLISMLFTVSVIGYVHGRYRDLSIVTHLPLALGLVSASMMLFVRSGPYAAVFTGLTCAGLGLHALSNFIKMGLKGSGTSIVAFSPNEKLPDSSSEKENGRDDR